MSLRVSDVVLGRILSVAVMTLVLIVLAIVISTVILLVIVFRTRFAANLGVSEH